MDSIAQHRINGRHRLLVSSRSGDSPVGMTDSTVPVFDDSSDTASINSDGSMSAMVILYLVGALVFLVALIVAYRYMSPHTPKLAKSSPLDNRSADEPRDVEIPTNSDQGQQETLDGHRHDDVESQETFQQPPTGNAASH